MLVGSWGRSRRTRRCQAIASSGSPIRSRDVGDPQIEVGVRCHPESRLGVGRLIHVADIEGRGLVSLVEAFEAVGLGRLPDDPAGAGETVFETVVLRRMGPRAAVVFDGGPPVATLLGDAASGASRRAVSPSTPLGVDRGHGPRCRSGPRRPAPSARLRRPQAGRGEPRPRGRGVEGRDPPRPRGREPNPRLGSRGPRRGAVGRPARTTPRATRAPEAGRPGRTSSRSS